MNYKTLVNKNHPYNKDYFNNFILQKVKGSDGGEYLLEKKTLKAYLDLKKDDKKKKSNVREATQADIDRFLGG